jgi:thiol-disulfide isomerase/thioredoxin
MELPHFEEIQDEYGDEIIIIAVDIGPFVGLGDSEDALALLDELDINFLTASTDDFNAVSGYKVFGTPATYFIAPDGEVVEKWVGFLSKEQVIENIENLLGHSSSSG